MNVLGYGIGNKLSVGKKKIRKTRRTEPLDPPRDSILASKGGASGRIRTDGLRFTKPLLYR